MTANDALSDDFRDVLVELADAGAEFVLIGGWAMAAYGRTRATEDLDVYVRPTPENAERVFAALAMFGAPVFQHRVTPAFLASEGYGYRFGVKPYLIEILTKISGVHFDEAITDAREVDVDGRKVLVIGRAALLANKRAAGRPKDVDDVLWLEAHPNLAP